MGVSKVLILLFKKTRRAYSMSLQLIINVVYNETDALEARLYNLKINNGYNKLTFYFILSTNPNLIEFLS